ncbi:MAG TPA: DUF6263 family protein [Fimbriimonadaceae bacterium]|nr:DUF6263 family protein [Fimbriimonadaceae bacterium]HRJ97335.1 DUF6263 family protein [Fimbriimonadaceae bacterium]
MKKFGWIAALLLVAAIGCKKDDAATTEGTGSTTKTTTGSSTPAPAEEITLRFKGEAGDKFKMTVSMEADADFSALASDPNVPAEQKKMIEGPQTMKVEAVNEQEITEVKDGKFTVKDTNLEFNASGTGVLSQQADQMAKTEKGKTETKVYDELHKSTHADADKPESNPMSVVFPEKAIKVGDTWTSETEFTGEKVTAHYTFEKMENVNGKDCVVLLLDFKDNPNVTNTQPMRLWFDKTNGWPVKGEAEVQMQQPEQKIKMTMKFRMTTD